MNFVSSLILPATSTWRYLRSGRIGIGFANGRFVTKTGDGGNISGVCPIGTPVLGVKGTKILTVSGTPTAGKVVTIGSTTYTWRATPGAEANAVKINGTNGSASNLFLAITKGTLTGALEYGSATVAHPTHTASNDVAGQVLVTALVAGVSGNVALAEDDANTAWASGATAISNGVDCTPATEGDMQHDTSKLYIATADMTITSTAGWYNPALSAGV